MPFGARGVRPDRQRRQGCGPRRASPMPFGARGVRPSTRANTLGFGDGVSNAFRREGRSPRANFTTGVENTPLRSPMPFGVRGVRPETDRLPRHDSKYCLQCLSARGAFAPKPGTKTTITKTKSPMPFGVRGVRPIDKDGDEIYRVKYVSNAFRREGRSPPVSLSGDVDRGVNPSPMPFGVRGVRPWRSLASLLVP